MHLVIKPLHSLLSCMFNLSRVRYHLHGQIATFRNEINIFQISTYSSISSKLIRQKVEMLFEPISGFGL